MQMEYMNYAEFPCFWNVLDTSHSMFIKEMEDAERFDFIEHALDLYLDKRYRAYCSHGMSPTILQVTCDAFAHKRNSTFAKNKLISILKKSGFVLFDQTLSGKADNTEYLNKFHKEKAAFRVISSKNDVFFAQFLECIGEEYEFMSGRKAKAPDFVIKNHDQIYIVEHKHIKEGGGGQDKQIDELIEFITYMPTSENVHYVSYLDGYYFNIMRSYLLGRGASKSKKPAKPLIQIENIRKALEKQPNNYFINTYGLRELILSRNFR